MSAHETTETRPGGRAAATALLDALEPGLAWLASDLLGASRPIDLLARDAARSAVLVLRAERGGDAAGLTRLLGQLAWVEARIPDWLKLAPGLGLDPHAPARGWLLCPEFEAETLEAWTRLGSDCIRMARLGGGDASAETRVEALSGPGLRAPDPGPAAQTPGPAFRSGLREEDFALDPEEKALFRTPFDRPPAARAQRQARGPGPAGAPPAEFRPR